MRIRCSAVLCVALFVALSWTPILGSGRRQHTFRTSTELVRVYATVRDKSGHLVTDLQAEDFEIRERGTRVPLTLFSADVQPIRLAILVDMSGTHFERAAAQQLRDGLSAFVDQFSADDRATVGWFSHEQIVIAPALTGDTSALKTLIESEIRIERAHPSLAAFTESRDNVIAGLQFRGRPLWNAIAAGTAALAREPGRKVILVLANGNNTTNLAGYPRLEELRLALAADEFMIYSVQGFEPRRADFGPRHADQITGSWEERQTTLQQLSDLTGGGSVTAPFDPVRGRGGGWTGVDIKKNGLSLAFRSQLAGIIEELRRQYTLGFVPTRRDGKAKTIEVRVSRPETDVWARKTYIAPEP